MADEYRRMKQLTGTPAEWAASFVVLGDGEIAVERTGNKSKIKMGDGVSTFQQLPYLDIGDSGAGNVSQNRVPKGNGLGGLVNSSMLDDGTLVTLTGSLRATSALTVVGTTTLQGVATANNLSSSTQPVGTNNLRVATTAFVKAAIDAGLQFGAANRVAKAGDTMTGKLTISAGGLEVVGDSKFLDPVHGPTANPTANNTQLATTAFVQSFAGTIGINYVRKSGDTMNGGLTINGSVGLTTTVVNSGDIKTTTFTASSTARAPTVAPGTIDTQIATTAFVAEAVSSGGSGGGPGGVAGLAPGSVLFGAANGTIGQNVLNLFWDDTNSRLGVGTSLPEAALHVSDGDIIDSSYGGTISSFIVRQAAGTEEAPTAIIGAAQVGSVVAQGYDGAAYQSISQIAHVTDGAVTAASSPGHMILATTPAGTVAPAEVMRITSDAKVGIGAAAPLAKLHVAGDIKANTTVTVADDAYATSWLNNLSVPTKNAVFNKIQSMTTSGGVTGLIAGAITFGKTDGSLAQDPTQLVWNDTNNFLGVGTNAPVARLHVEDGSTVMRKFGSAPSLDMYAAGGTLAAATAVTGTAIAAALTARAYDGFGYRPLANINFMTDGSPAAASSPGRIAFQTTPAGSLVPVDRMNIISSGNVGIATAAPTAKLHVAGDIKADTTVTVATDPYALTWASNLSVPTKKDIYDKIEALVLGTGGGVSGLATGGLTFGSSGGTLAQDPTLQWDNTNKRLGVGTNAPAAKLDVQGDAAVSDHSYIYTPYNGAVNTATRRAGIKFDGTEQAINFVNAGLLTGYIDSAGRWGLGTAAPSQKLDVVGSGRFYKAASAAAFVNVVNDSHSMYVAVDNVGGYILTAAASPISFYTNNTEKMRVTAAGDVGIGTALPAAKFSVAGATWPRIAITKDALATWFMGPAEPNNAWELRLNANPALISATTGSKLGINEATPTNQLTVSATYGTAGDSSSGFRLTMNNGAGGLYASGYNLEANVAHNAEFISGTGWTSRYATASIYQQKEGDHYWYGNTGMGSGGAFTPVQNMRLDYGGNLTLRGDIGVSGVTRLGGVVYTGYGVADTVYSSFELGGGRTGSGGAYFDMVTEAGADYQTRIIRGAGVDGAFNISNAGAGPIGIKTEGAGYITLATANTERLKIAAAGNVGIGNSDPQSKLHIGGTSAANGSVSVRIDNSQTSGSSDIIFTDTGAQTGRICVGGSTFASYAGAKSMSYDTGGGDHAFYINGSPRMGIEGGAAAGIRFGSRVSYAGERFTFDNDLASSGVFIRQAVQLNTFGIAIQHQYTNAGGLATMMSFLNYSGSNIGTIKSTASATSFNTAGGLERMANVVPAPDAGEVIDAIQIVSHDWTEGGHVRWGVVTEHLAEVFEEGTTRSDEVNESWQWEKASLVPLLLKEAQTLRSRVSELESIVAAMDARLTAGGL